MADTKTFKVWIDSLHVGKCCSCKPASGLKDSRWSRDLGSTGFGIHQQSLSKVGSRDMVITRSDNMSHSDAMNP